MFQIRRLFLLVFCLIILFPLVVFSWEGFDWEQWRVITNAVKPTIITPQSHSSELFPLLQKEGDVCARIQSIQEWEQKRDRILGVLESIIGTSSKAKIIPPYADILGEASFSNYKRFHLRISSEPDDWITAYLLIPDPMPVKPVPAMIVLHQTVSQGKDEPCGIEGNAEMAFALELAQKGFVCIVPDMIGFGERTPPGAPPYHNALQFFRKHPDWSFFGKMVWDIRQVVNYLETLPFVDMYRLGCMGHSHGGYGTIIGAIFEPRITAVVVSCGFTTLRKDPIPERWSHLTALMPKLGFYKDHIEEAPFDWHEIIACMAPRPFYLWGTLNDAIFPSIDNFPEIFEQVESVYSLYGAKDYFHPRLGEGPHSFPTEQRNEAYNWLKRNIPVRPAKETLGNDPGDIAQWEKKQPTIKNLLQRDIGSVEPPSMESSFAVLSTIQHEGYTEKMIQYFTAPGERISAYLLYPDTLKKKNPAIIVFHQTTENGKEEPVGRKGRASMHLAPELAIRGYYVLAPDSITAGERIDSAGPYNTRNVYRDYPNSSALGKMIQDGRRAIDILQSIPEVDRNRIGAIGHSLGAEEALFVAAFDERIKAAAASCGFAPLRVESNPARWARDHWFSYMPRLRIDLRAKRMPAWDFDDVIRLVAPRGYFNYQTEDDDIFPEGYAAHAMTLALKPLWCMYEKENHLQSILEPGPHDFSSDAKQIIYDWMDAILFD